MGNDDRKPFLSSNVLDQDFLDQTHDSLVNQLELIVNITAPPLSKTGQSYSNPSANIVQIALPNHRLKKNEIVSITNATDGAIVGDYPIFNVPSDDIIQIDKGVAVAPASGTLDISAERIVRISDRNKYVGGTFYEARMTFPVIQRTVGEFLSATLEFSTLQLELNNADGFFNSFLPAGEDFAGWIDNTVEVKLGLRDVASTYKTVFSGKITEQSGFRRTVQSVVFIARDDFEKLNVSFPSTVFTDSSFPNISADKVNTLVPVIYGDWTTNVETNLASIPPIVVNGADLDMDGTNSRTNNTQLVISANDNTVFDTAEVYLKRGEKAWRIDSADITNVSAGKNSFEIIQQSNNMTPITVDTVAQVFEYDSSDVFLVKVRGKDLGTYDDNIVSQAKDILTTYAGAISADFHTSWDTYRDKTVGGGAAVENAVGDFLSRIYIDTPRNALEFCLSLLEQVRLEVFLNRDQKLQILSNHLDDFVASPSYQVKNWDIETKSFNLQLDERNNFNRSKGQFNFLPNRKENFQETRVQKNTLAITQAGREISKRVLFPNLYEADTVKNQVIEILRLTSAYLEVVNVNLTWRSMLLDIGDFVKLNINIQGTIFENVPAIIRQIGYDPQGIKIPMKLWSLQMVPFSGYSPGYEGITGGANATIIEE